MSQSWAVRLRRRLEHIDQAGQRRQLRVAEGACSPRRRIDGRELLCFSGNDYLGLASHPRLVKALTEAASSHGVGSGAAHLLGGHSPLHQRLEEALADWLGRDRALLFSTGYMANLGLVQALADKDTLLVGDKLNHASLVDAARLSPARFQRYPHVDVSALGRRLDAFDGPRLVLSDGIFSMDGDRAPLREMAELCRDPLSALVVDEAHALGVVGPQGRGSVAEAGLDQVAVPLIMGTLGKALGAFGAFVAGQDDWVESVLQRARSYVFTTAAPGALAAAGLAALETLREEGWRARELEQRVQQFRSGAASLGLDLLPSTTPIQPLILGTEARALAASAQLQDAGIWVPAVRPPTVPAGSSRLRITFSASHQASDVDRLLDALSGLAR